MFWFSLPPTARAPARECYSASLLMKPKLQRNPYRYRRDLPHITKADWPHFITFRTWEWWILPPAARTVV